MTQAIDAVALKRKQTKLVAILILLLSMAFLLGFTGYYLISASVGSVDRSGPPRYERSIYGSSGLGALTQPMGLAVDSDGNVYTIDTGKAKVQVFDREGVMVASFPREKTKVKLVNPLYVAVSPKNEVFVSDRGSSKLLVFSAQGRYLREFKPKGQPNFNWAPVALSFDSNGDLYVTDFGTQQLRVFNREGRLLRSIGGAGDTLGRFQFPNGIAIGSDRVYVSDSNNGRVQVFEKATGKPLTEFSAGSLPRGVALDEAGRLFVVDTLDHQVGVFDAKDGRQLFSYGGLGQGEGQLLFPNSIAFDGQNRIYVSDRENNRITVWEYK